MHYSIVAETGITTTTMIMMIKCHIFFCCFFFLAATLTKAWQSTSRSMYPYSDGHVRRLPVRGIDPSESPAVGSSVVAGANLNELGIWEFQSFTVEAIWDQDATKTTTTRVPHFGVPLDDNATRYVTLQIPRHGSVTMRLASIYSHGLSSLWFLEL